MAILQLVLVIVAGLFTSGIIAGIYAKYFSKNAQIQKLQKRLAEIYEEERIAKLNNDMNKFNLLEVERLVIDEKIRLLQNS